MAWIRWIEDNNVSGNCSNVDADKSAGFQANTVAVASKVNSVLRQSNLITVALMNALGISGGYDSSIGDSSTGLHKDIKDALVGLKVTNAVNADYASVAGKILVSADNEFTMQNNKIIIPYSYYGNALLKWKIVGTIVPEEGQPEYYFETDILVKFKNDRIYSITNLNSPRIYGSNSKASCEYYFYFSMGYVSSNISDGFIMGVTVNRKDLDNGTIDYLNKVHALNIQHIYSYDDNIYHD